MHNVTVLKIPTIEDPERFTPEPRLVKDPQTRWHADGFHGEMLAPRSGEWVQLHPFCINVIDGLRSGRPFAQWAEELPEYRDPWGIYGKRRAKLARKFIWKLHTLGYVEIPFETPPDLFNGRYRRIKELGRGGLGIVQLCTDETTGEVVVTKYPWGFKSSVKSGQKAIAAEIEGLTAVKGHPSFARIIDHFDVRGLLHIVKEFVPGHTLFREAKDTGIVDPVRRRAVFEQCALALHALHEAGFLHLDASPHNFFVTPEGRIVLSDLGSVRRMDADGNVLRAAGTPGYAASEVRLRKKYGKHITRRTDIYTLGRVYLFLLLGKRTSRTAYLEGLTQFLDEHGVTGAERAFILYCCADHPEQRPATIPQMLESLP